MVSIFYQVEILVQDFSVRSTVGLFVYGIQELNVFKPESFTIWKEMGCYSEK